MFEKKPNLRLVGEDGNAFAILWRAKRVSEKIWTKEEWEIFSKEARSGDYNNLLRVCMKYFNVDQDVEEDVCHYCGCELCECDCDDIDSSDNED